MGKHCHTERVFIPHCSCTIGSSSLLLSPGTDCIRSPHTLCRRCSTLSFLLSFPSLQIFNVYLAGRMPYLNIPGKHHIPGFYHYVSLCLGPAQTEVALYVTFYPIVHHGLRFLSFQEYLVQLILPFHSNNPPYYRPSMFWQHLLPKSHRAHRAFP